MPLFKHNVLSRSTNSAVFLKLKITSQRLYKNIFLLSISRNPKVEQTLGEKSPREKATLKGWCEEEWKKGYE